MWPLATCKSTVYFPISIEFPKRSNTINSLFHWWQSAKNHVLDTLFSWFWIFFFYYTMIHMWKFPNFWLKHELDGSHCCFTCIQYATVDKSNRRIFEKYLGCGVLGRLYLYLCMCTKRLISILLGNIDCQNINSFYVFHFSWFLFQKFKIDGMCHHLAHTTQWIWTWVNCRLRLGSLNELLNTFFNSFCCNGKWWWHKFIEIGTHKWQCISFKWHPCSLTPQSSTKRRMETIIMIVHLMWIPF